MFRVLAMLREDPGSRGLDFRMVQMVAARGDAAEAARRLRSCLEQGRLANLRRVLDHPDFDPAVRSDTAFQAAMSEARTRLREQLRQVRGMISGNVD